MYHNEEGCYTPQDVQQLETSCTGQEVVTEVDNDEEQRQQSEIPLVSTEVNAREEQESTGITHTYKHMHVM